MIGNTTRFERTTSFLVLTLILILPFLPSLREMVPIVSFHGQTLMGFMKEILVLSFSAVCLIRIILHPRIKIPFSPFLLLLIFYIAWGAMHIPNVLGNTSIGMNSFRFQFIYAFITLFATTITLSEKAAPPRMLDLEPILTVMLVQSVVVSLIAIYELFNPDIKFLLYGEKYLVMQETILSVPGAENVRSVSTLGNPINLGLFLMTAIVALLYWYEKRRTPARTALFSTLFLLNMTAIGLTLSRTAYLIFASLLLVYLLYRLKKGDLGFILLSLFVAACVFLFFSVLKKDFFDSILLMVERFYNLIDMAVVRDDPRVYNWRNFLSFVFSRSLSVFWGAGLGVSNPSGKEGTFTVENSYLSLFGELGIVGLVCFTLIFLRFLLNILSLVRSLKHEKEALALGLYAILFFIASITTDAHNNNPFSAYFWIFLTYSEIALIKLRTRGKND